MNRYNGIKILELVQNLGEAESSKMLFQKMKEGWEKDINNANLFTKLFKKDDLTIWRQNIENCEDDIRAYDLKIKDTIQAIDELGYDDSDIKKIQDFQTDGGYPLERDYPWIKLLSNQERDTLIVEVATDRKGTYSELMDFHNDYINSFATDAERLDFIHGYLRGPQGIEADRSDAYKIGETFYATKDNYDIKFEPGLTITRAEDLPDGWKWHMWDDGSGSLQSPTGKCVFQYDLATSEYRYSGEKWDFFDGYPYETVSLKEMMKNAERRISASGISKEEYVNAHNVKAILKSDKDPKPGASRLEQFRNNASKGEEKNELTL